MADLQNFVSNIVTPTPKFSPQLTENPLNSALTKI